MSIPRFLLSAAAILAVALFAAGDPPAPINNPPPALPIVGKWHVEFANGVKEECVIREDGTSTVVEPLRSSPGKATLRDKSVIIVSEDDRVERWTVVGRRVVVEHWFPASQFAAGGTPVVGIADHAE